MCLRTPLQLLAIIWLLYTPPGYSASAHLGAAGFTASINFQPKGTAPPPGYLADCGEAFQQRGDGFAYGWNLRNTAQTFERGLSTNKLLDTGIKMQVGAQSFSWEIQVPNGLYDIVVAAGDPAVTEGDAACYAIDVEGTTAIPKSVPRRDSWAFGTNVHIQTWVKDRRLTIVNGRGATKNSLCYITIQQIAPIYWGAAIIDNAGTHKCPVDYVNESEPGVLGHYERLTGKRISLLHWGNSWNSGSLSSQTNYMAKMWARGTIPVFVWSPGGHSADPKYSLSSILAGTHDSFLTNWFRVAKAYGKPFFLNFAREMNGTWYTWSEGHPLNESGPPGSFTNMWRHVHNISRAVGCTNITWIWAPDRDLANDKHLQPLSRFYPGDDYVDWVGLDLYNAGGIPPFAGEFFQEVYAQTYSNVVRIAPSKPIMVCETGTRHLKRTPKPAWIAEALMQLPSAFPNIRGFLWFNWNDGKTNKNWPIQGGGNTLPYQTAPVDWVSVTAFAHGIASPFYLSSIFTNQANLTTSPIQPVLLLPPPTNILASGQSGRVRLRWSPVTGARGYNIYRSSSAAAPIYQRQASTTAAATEFNDTSVINGTPYSYVITAENLAGESLDSVPVSATPLAGVARTANLQTAR